MASQDPAKFIQEQVTGDKVVLFTKSYCPYSRRARETVEKLGVHPTIIELDKRDDGSSIQNELGKMTGASTVPRVFIGGQFYGGADDTVKGAESGDLEKLFKQVGAV